MPQALSAAFSVARQNISLAGAQRVLAAAQAEATLGGWHISVAVVDLAGQLVAFARDDAAIGISPEVAIAKARTAALLQIPSKDFEDFINAGKPSFLATPGATPLEGGVPLRIGTEIVGAVGVSGAHGPNDSKVAEAGAAALHPF